MDDNPGPPCIEAVVVVRLWRDGTDEVRARIIEVDLDKMLERRGAVVGTDGIVCAVAAAISRFTTGP